MRIIRSVAFEIVSREKRGCYNVCEVWGGIVKGGPLRCLLSQEAGVRLG